MPPAACCANSRRSAELSSPIFGPEIGSRSWAGVLTDFRGELLRFGPAPYLSDRQLDDAMGLLGEVARQ